MVCTSSCHMTSTYNKYFRNILASWFVWLSATRTAKLLPHLWHRPQDIIYVPAFILFGYYFAIMKIYALLTLHEVYITSFFGENLFNDFSFAHPRRAGVPVLASVMLQLRQRLWIKLTKKSSVRSHNMIPKIISYTHNSLMTRYAYRSCRIIPTSHCRTSAHPQVHPVSIISICPPTLYLHYLNLIYLNPWTFFHPCILFSQPNIRKEGERIGTIT